MRCPGDWSWEITIRSNIFPIGAPSAILCVCVPRPWRSSLCDYDAEIVTAFTPITEICVALHRIGRHKGSIVRSGIDQ
jgi:hypothetical protein